MTSVQFLVITTPITTGPGLTILILQIPTVNCVYNINAYNDHKVVTRLSTMLLQSGNNLVNMQLTVIASNVYNIVQHVHACICIFIRFLILQKIYFTKRN